MAAANIAETGVLELSGVEMERIGSIGLGNVEEVLLGSNGVLARLHPDSAVMDMSTVDPLLTDRVAAAAAKGIAFVEWGQVTSPPMTPAVASSCRSVGTRRAATAARRGSSHWPVTRRSRTCA